MKVSASVDTCLGNRSTLGIKSRNVVYTVWLLVKINPEAYTEAH